MHNVFPFYLSVKMETRCFWLLGFFGKNLLSLYLRLFGTGTTEKLTLFAQWNSIFIMSNCWIWQSEKRLKTYLRQIMPAEFQTFCCILPVFIYSAVLNTFEFFLTISILSHPKCWLLRSSGFFFCTVMLKFLRLLLF